MDTVEQVLEQQDGVIARAQALAAGLDATAVKRRLRRREWVTVHTGVYVNHTGPLTWRQRAWAAVLACWPAALDGASAIRAHEGPGSRVCRDDAPIEVMIDHGRKLKAPEGVRVRRSRRFREAALANLSPPRLRYEDAIIDRADRAATDLDLIATLADACGGRRTTAARLRHFADALPRLARRRLILAVLDDVANGTCSVLEHRYLTHVERAHNLPCALRQVAARDAQGRPMFRDVRYGGSRPHWRLIVELDGRLGHSSARERDRDLERDLDAALDREETVRLGYGQAFDRPCETARKLARIMRRLGWQGRPTHCADCPTDIERDRGIRGQPG